MKQEKIQLPENASRPLKPGEKYEPILKPQNSYPEITPYSVIMGVVMAPATMTPDDAPMDWMMTFSPMAFLRFIAEDRPTAMMAIGMAASNT